uniref:mitogen-activated protein kinase kinase n=1 Tax=Neospora caninum (strain Liverpool) TaxID=572307 RepID=A0A0F7UAY8_NEOCL|nr:TPA: protein kinase (incomplete catalytic triad),putative [Neospora caninum Liverpool]
MNRCRPPPLIAHLGTTSSSPYSSEDFRCGTTSSSSSPTGIWSSPTADLGRSNGSIPSPHPSSHLGSFDAADSSGWVRSPYVSGIPRQSVSPTAADLLSFSPFHSPTRRLPQPTLSASSTLVDSATLTCDLENGLSGVVRELEASSSTLSQTGIGDAFRGSLARPPSYDVGRNNVTIPLSGTGHPHFAMSCGSPVRTSGPLVSHGHCARKERPSEFIPVSSENLALQRTDPDTPSSGLSQSPCRSQPATAETACPSPASIPSTLSLDFPNRQDVESVFRAQEERQRAVAFPMRREKLSEFTDTPQRSLATSVANEAARAVSVLKIPGWSPRFPDKDRPLCGSRSADDTHGFAVEMHKAQTAVRCFSPPVVRSERYNLSEEARSAAEPCEPSSARKETGDFDRGRSPCVEALSASRYASSRHTRQHDGKRLSPTAGGNSSVALSSSRVLPAQPHAVSSRLGSSHEATSSRHSACALPASGGSRRSPQAAGQSQSSARAARKANAPHVASAHPAVSSSSSLSRFDFSRLPPEAALWSPPGSPLPADESGVLLVPSSFLLSHRAFKKASYRLSSVALDGVQLSCPFEHDQPEEIETHHARTESPSPPPTFSSLALRGRPPNTEPFHAQACRCASSTEGTEVSNLPRAMSFEENDENNGETNAARRKPPCVAFSSTPSTERPPVASAAPFPSCAGSHVLQREERGDGGYPKGGEEARESEHEREDKWTHERKRENAGRSEAVFDAVHHPPERRLLQKMRHAAEVGALRRGQAAEDSAGARGHLTRDEAKLQRDRFRMRKSPCPASRRLGHDDLDWSRSRDVGRGRSARVCVLPHKSSGRLVAVKEVHVGCFDLYRGLDDVTKRNRYQLACEVKTHRLISCCSDVAALSFLLPSRGSSAPVSSTSRPRRQSPSPLFAPSCLPRSSSLFPSPPCVSFVPLSSSGSSVALPSPPALLTASASPCADTSPSSSRGQPCASYRLLSSSSLAFCPSSSLFPPSRCDSQARVPQSWGGSLSPPADPSCGPREEPPSSFEALHGPHSSSSPLALCPSSASLPSGGSPAPVPAVSSRVRLSSLCFLPFSSAAVSPSQPKALHASCSPLASPFPSSPASSFSFSPLTPSTMYSTNLLTPTPQTGEPSLSPSCNASCSSSLISTSCGSSRSGRGPLASSLPSPLGPLATPRLSSSTFPPNTWRGSEANDGAAEPQESASSSSPGASASLSCSGSEAMDRRKGPGTQRWDAALPAHPLSPYPLKPNHSPPLPLLPESDLVGLLRPRSSSACPLVSGFADGPSLWPRRPVAASPAVSCPLSCFLLPFLGAYRWQSKRGGCVHVALEYMHYGTLGDIVKALRLLRAVRCVDPSTKKRGNAAPASPAPQCRPTNRSLQTRVCSDWRSTLSGGRRRGEGGGFEQGREEDEEAREKDARADRDGDQEGGMEARKEAKEKTDGSDLDAAVGDNDDGSRADTVSLSPGSSPPRHSSLPALCPPTERRCDASPAEDGGGSENMRPENSGSSGQCWLPPEWKEERQRKWAKRKRKIQTACLAPETRSSEEDIGIPESILKLIAFQVLGALSFLHRHRCIHRDIKPQNIMINNEGIVKVGDFGISRFLDVEGNDSLTFVGTELYMSPERLHQHFSAVHLNTSRRRTKTSGSSHRLHASPAYPLHSASSVPSASSSAASHPSRGPVPRNVQAARETLSANSRGDSGTEQGDQNPAQGQAPRHVGVQADMRREGEATEGDRTGRAAGEAPRVDEKTEREKPFAAEETKAGDAHQPERGWLSEKEERCTNKNDSCGALRAGADATAVPRVPVSLLEEHSRKSASPRHPDVSQATPPVPLSFSRSAVEHGPERAQEGRLERETDLRGEKEKGKSKKAKERSRRKEIFAAMEKEEKRVGAYSFPSDIWSVGVLLFELAAVHHPFPEGLPCDLKDCNIVSLLQSRFHGSKTRKRRSYEFRDFLFNCLRVKPGKRATADRLLLHPWLLEGMASRQHFKRWIVKVYRRASSARHLLLEAEGIAAAGEEPARETRSTNSAGGRENTGRNASEAHV